MRIMASVLVLGLCVGCATRPPLSPTSRILLFCNPVGHAVDLALVGAAAAATVRSRGVVALDFAAGVGAAPHERGTWSVPGVMCYDAIADKVDATEAANE